MLRRSSDSWTIVATSLTAAIWLALCAPAFAQDTVMTPLEACIENFGYLGCGPEGNPLPPQQDHPIVLYWTALALSETTMKAGASHGENSADAADQTALANCRRNGPSDCKILTDASNRCLALAFGSKGTRYGYSPASDRKSAASAAMAECRSHGGANCVVIAAPCADDDPRWSAPLPLPTGVQTSPVDPRMVGTWELLINPGNWIWRVAANGTYEFHSEAGDGAPTHAGTFTASQDHYTLHAINLSWDDTGTYAFQGPDTVVAKGKLGTGTWRRMFASGGH
jgi:hypothetical protein